MKNSNKNSRPVIFGEVLFDTFPDGTSVLGGAPFNVAWHLKGFGLDPLFISSIGSDRNGQLVEKKMLEWGLDTAALQQDPDHQTGEVSITLTNGQPSFEILPDQAYDFIAQEKAQSELNNSTPSLLYFGSLVSRGEVSGNTLNSILKKKIPSYVDINLRKPWWKRESVIDAMKAATWLKLNDEEIGLLCDEDDIKQAASVLLNRYELEWIIVTEGAKGAFIASKDQMVECQPKKVENIKDTVGAGDAFSAVTIYGIINQWPIERILQKAVEFAAMICGQRGATVDDKSFYKNILERWQKE